MARNPRRNQDDGFPDELHVHTPWSVHERSRGDFDFGEDDPAVERRTRGSGFRRGRLRAARASLAEPVVGPTTTNAMMAPTSLAAAISRDMAGQATCWSLRPDVHRGTLSVSQAGGLLAMAIPTREPFRAYLLVRAAMLRRRRAGAPIAASRLEEHAHALELLADLIRTLPDDDERLLMLSTLAVRDGQFVPGAST